MEVWSWVLIVVALLLLGAGTLRFDWLVAALRQRIGAADATPRAADAPPRGAGAHGAAAAHTGHVPAHGAARRKPAFHRSGRRH